MGTLMAVVDWRKVEAMLVDQLRLCDCFIEEDDLSDLTTRHVNITQLAKALANEFNRRPSPSMADDNAGIPQA